MNMQKALWWSVAVVVVVMVVEGRRVDRQASPCNRDAPCTLLSACNTYQELLKRPTPQLLQEIQRAICNGDRRNPKVCCPRGSGVTSPTPTPKPTPTPTPNPGNGEALLPSTCTSGARVGQVGISVVNGRDAELGRLPFMAVLGYDSPTAPTWECGGALINERYVLTAAHCIDERFTFGRKVAVVRLGEYNIGTAKDCETRPSGQFCAPAPQDFAPAEIIVHPTFHQRADLSDDIALIRLDRKAPLSDFIKPICLPSSPAEVEGIPRAEVAGWGLTEEGKSAQILQSAFLPFVDKATCNPHFENKLVPEQICFGGGKQDSCQGDSGGPIFVSASSSTPLHVGIVSFGKKGVGCGSVGVPAVYTHVAAYRSWITSQLRP